MSETLGLFDGVLARGAVRDATSDRAWLQAMLDVEAALAGAEARAVLFAPAVADEIARACRAESFDIAAIGRAAAAKDKPGPPPGGAPAPPGVGGGRSPLRLRGWPVAKSTGAPPARTSSIPRRCWWRAVRWCC